MNDDERQELKDKIMAADLENKQIDTAYKRGLLRFEPWKLVFGGAAAMAAAIVAAATLLHLLTGL